MKNLIKYVPIGLMAIMVLISPGCKKGFLDAKPSTNILQPKTLDDLQGLLENYSAYLSPGLPTLAADEYVFINYPIWQSARRATERNSYIWAKDLFAGESDGRDWSAPYQTVFYTNNVLNALNRIKDQEKDVARWNTLKGWALFKRAFAYYELLSCFSPAYDISTAKTDLGVPLKLNPSIDDIQPRASVQQGYDLVLEDLNTALPWLSESLPQNNRDRPSKIATNALLARIYLSMRNYVEAEKYADATLQLYNKLIDYNTLSLTNIQPFSKTNDELIYFKITAPVYASTTISVNLFTRINPELIALFEPNDLRAQVYFAKQTDGTYIMKYQYNGNTGVYPFTGLATDEIYLIKAECAVRRNDLPTALQYLNAVLIKRFKTGTYSSFTASDQNAVLAKVLLERRKELVWRNLRWFDIKRLNKENANITLSRELNGQSYSLPPNDPRYVFPIPDDEIALSGIQQNIR